MPVRFETTMWSVLREAREDPQRALEHIVGRYREPLFRFFLQRGLQEADAEDRVQEVFLEVCEDDFLTKADAARGRFRTLLLAVAKHVLVSNQRREQAKKRGGAFETVPLEEDVFQRAPANPQDEEFHRLWAENLVRQALEKLRTHPRLHRVVELFYFEGKPQKEIAPLLDRTEKDVENDLASARRQLRRAIAEQIEDYASSREEFEQEIAELSRYL